MTDRRTFEPHRPKQDRAAHSSRASSTAHAASHTQSHTRSRINKTLTQSNGVLPFAKMPSGFRPELDLNGQLRLVHHRKYPEYCVRLSMATMFLSTIFLLWLLPSNKIAHHAGPKEWQRVPRMPLVLQPTIRSGDRGSSGPEKWLQDHIRALKEGKVVDYLSSRPRAAIISLVRNEELEGILQSMQQLESRWNHEYNYPWIFFNEKSFSEEFKNATSNATSARTSYEVVSSEHWSTPDWIDEDRYYQSLDYLGLIGVGKGWMLSYRNMCRWNSGFFYRHQALKDYDYYWRVEPDVRFFCNIDYDPFRLMRDNDLVYGFNMNILDDARSFASLWHTTQDFMSTHPDLIHPDADLDWLLDPNNANEYSNCQFFSNFEIGSLNFFRSHPNQAYFDHLDRSGGFYYERYGDAPVHTLSVAMFAPKNKTWFFHDIGYQHDIAIHCPADGVDSGRCNGCKPTDLDANFYKLVPMESPQRKPRDTCIRQWLGGEWLDKKTGWSQEAELVLGGDGYGGYLKSVFAP